jgi:sugar lactone lactonase YvrE
MGILSRIYPPRRTGAKLLLMALLGSFFWLSICSAQPVTQANTVPLLLPGALAYDSVGNLYFAETARHVIRRINPTGALTTVAGTGTQGFGGDTGPAANALLDSPTGLAIDSSGNLFIADTHNQRIRRVDASTAIITTVAGVGTAGFAGDGKAALGATLCLPGALTVDALGDLYFADTCNHRVRRIDGVTGLIGTVAGNGTQGFAGDGSPATAASIDSPAGIAVDGQGNIFLADAHNQRVRRIGHATGVMTSVAGIGVGAFSGDGGSAAIAAVALPHGLSIDGPGNLYISDLSNHRIRRIDAVTGAMSTVAGEGTQTFAGDGGLATAASLDSPRAVTLSGAGLVALADTGNERVRRIDAAGIIETAGGLGTYAPGVLTISGPSVVGYGSGSLTAKLTASSASGTVTFFDLAGGIAATLGAVSLLGNVANFSTALLAAGSHSISATYGGDGTHSSEASTAVALTVSPAPVAGTPVPVTALFGDPVPALNGTLTGVLPRDVGQVSVSFSLPATSTSGPGALAPGAYPITGLLTGPAAGNYSLTTTAASVTVTPAPTTAAVMAPATGTAGNALVVTSHVASATPATPNGTVVLLDGAGVVETAALSPSGDASFPGVNLSAGTHALSVTYGGNGDFLGSVSAPVVTTIGSGTTSDFTLTAIGAASVTVTAGTAASFSFAVVESGPALGSPILLAVAGLPPGATGSFSPAYLPPGNAAPTFVLTVQTPVAGLSRSKAITLAGMLPLMLLGLRARKRFGRLLLGFLAGVTLMSFTGCGERVLPASAIHAVKAYTVTVTATATGTAGAVLVHSASVNLQLQ